jgi:hypothetical protein
MLAPMTSTNQRNPSSASAHGWAAPAWAPPASSECHPPERRAHLRKPTAGGSVVEEVIGRVSTPLRRFRTYLWPAPGQSTHGRIVDSTRWRVVRLIAYPLLAAIAVIIYAGFTTPAALHNEWDPETGRYTVDAGPNVWPTIGDQP